MTWGDRSRVAVAGTGLIGASIAMAAARTGDGVRGFDPDPETLSAAAAVAGLEACASLEECVAGADFVFVCVPIDAIASVSARCLAADRKSVVSDVGSVKATVLAQVSEAAAREDVERFVGGHPMGGSERAGPEAASASLVEGVAWVLTPADWTSPDALRRLEEYVQRLGAHPTTMQADEHDRLVAVVSHLPQVASSALMSMAGGEHEDTRALTLAGSGFRDVTRLAGSDAALWRAILTANSGALAGAIDRFVDRLVELRDLAATGNGDELQRTLEQAQRARAALGAKAQVRAGVAVVQVPVPDRPGVLAHLTSALGDGDVNIEDLQIVHSPWGPSGVVHLTVLADRADAALAVLASNGFQPVRVA